MPKRDKSPPWKEPEFDEVGFMHKEMRAARVTIAVVLWTLPAAALSYGLTVAGVAVVAFFAGLGMMFLLKWVLPILKIDTSEYKRRDWMGHGATFFFSWLAFWILLLNPPFADLTSPVVMSVTFWDGSVARPVGCNVGDVVMLPTSILMNVTAGDNVAVSRVYVSFSGGPAQDLIHQGGTLWQATVSVPATATANLVVVDASGLTTYCGFGVS